MQRKLACCTCASIEARRIVPHAACIAAIGRGPSRRSSRHALRRAPTIVAKHRVIS